MPAQAPTPRTTRNSRGLRRRTSTSSADGSARVSRRRRSSGTPTAASLARALASPSAAAAAAASSPAARAPGARSSSPPAALQTLLEEQFQSATPAPATQPAASRPPVFPPPVALPPTAPAIFSPPPPQTPSPLGHRRVSAARSTPARSARGFGPSRANVRPSRYVTRFIDVTPSISPASGLESPGSETRVFRQRRDQEGEESFARELWIAIRNDHYMKGCWCGPPIIYNSREEAECGAGHLRFYVVGAQTKNLRVLQKKDDLRWHCICGNDEHHAVYEALINANGKRPAEDSEIDLLRQNQGVESGKSVDRVVPAPDDPASDGEEQLQAPENPQADFAAPAESMWSQACNIVGRAVATMGSPLATLLGKLREHLRGDAYETLDTRRKGGDNGIIVKRVKRRASVPPTEQSPADDADDARDNLIWTDDPAKRIGFDNIQRLANIFASQIQHIQDGNVVGGSSIEDIQMQIQDGQDLGASIAIHVRQEQKYGPMPPEASDDEKADRLLKVLAWYRDRLELGISFMQQIYDYGLFEELKNAYPVPPRRLPLGNVEFRQRSKMLGDFLCFLRDLDSVYKIDTATLETICLMIVDANAVHKQELLPSFVEENHNPTEDMPGFFPEDEPSVMEEVHAGDLHIQALYDFKFPEPEPSQLEEEQIRPGDYLLVPKPKGILKPSKEWDLPASPKYVTTPEKKRKLAFKNPVSKFIPPLHIPAKVMTAAEAERILEAKLRAEVVRDKRSIRMFEASRTVSRPRGLLPGSEDKWSLEAVEADDQEMGLTYHARKYDGFLSDLREDLEKKAEEDKESRARLDIERAPRRRVVRIPLPPLPSTPEFRRRRAHLLEGDSSSPAASSPEINPLMRPKAEEPPPEPAAKKRTPRTVEEFFENDEDDLEISTAKLEQLHIDRQIREEHEAGFRREIEEKRRREEEEAQREKERKIEEQRRREEEERRRKEAERLRELEAQRQREAEQFAALTGLRAPIRPLITPLSEDWDLRVASAARANPTTELVKTLEGQPLTRRDFEEKLLPPTAWLNDNVIIGSILHIADYINRTNGANDQEPKCAAFTSYFWPRLQSHGPGGCGRLLRRAGVRKANLLKIDTILIPICDNLHWTLAVIRPGRRTVSHIDSMRGGRGDPSVTAKLLELVRFILEDQFVEGEWRSIDYEAPRQTNGWDCGVFTITNALCLALGLNPKYSYTEQELTLQRRRLAAILLNEGFKGDFSLDGF